MIQLLNKYEKDGFIVEEYTHDGVTVSHTSRTPIPVPVEEIPIDNTPTTVEQRLEEIENTLNFILLGGM